MATVNITYKNNILRIYPDPIEIFLGETITWILETDPIVITSTEGAMAKQHMVSKLRLTIYFDEKTPFSSRRFTDISTSDGLHRIIIESDSAKTKGDYKYGVKLKDQGENKNIEDEDPIIRVR